MSANVNPLGPMPELVRPFKGQNMSAIAALPEVDAGGIVGAFSRHGIDPGQCDGGQRNH
jgi:hypothetical protein